jgi:D-alanyl-D-alanine-carboxypeptidase/D-alanyl-D-alanine-endopeptidase
MEKLIPLIQTSRATKVLPSQNCVRASLFRLAKSAALPVLLLAALPVVGQATQPISLAEADQRGATIFQQSAATGMVLVVVRNHEVMISGYGETAPGGGVKPDANSLVRLCSISKVFAGELLQQLANENKVSLDDPLQRYAPPKQIVPKGADGSVITLEELATHTAGLPREVSSYPRKTAHFTFPDENLRWRWLPRQKLNYEPGTAAVYSNIGFDLLGDALANATHESYAQLVDERILRPLKMWDTTLVPSQEQCARLLQGANDEGPCTDTQPSGASGGLYSTATDMAKYLESVLQISRYGVPISPTISVYLKPGQLKSTQGLSHAGDPTGIGLAWIQLGDADSPSMVLQKTGGGAGFETYIALNPKQQTGIFLARTDGEGHPEIDFYHEANNLLAALANVPPIPEKAPPVRPVRKKPLRRHSRAKKAAQ